MNDPVLLLIIKYHEAVALKEATRKRGEDYDSLVEAMDDLLFEIAETRPTTYDGARHKIRLLASEEFPNFANVIIETALLMIRFDDRGSDPTYRSREDGDAMLAEVAREAAE